MTVAEVLLRHGAGKPEILQMALERIRRTRDDPWWFGRLSDARGNLICLRLVRSQRPRTIESPRISMRGRNMSERVENAVDQRGIPICTRQRDTGSCKVRIVARPSERAGESRLRSRALLDAG